MTARDEPPPPRQGGLFGPLEEAETKRAPNASEGTPPVAPAQVAAEVPALAASLPGSLRMGTSSWAFAGWRGPVYADDAPKRHLSKHGLSAYSQHPLLRAVGVDRTFYAPVDADVFAGYAAQVPEDFRFLVKAWAEVTSPRLHGHTGLNPNFLDVHCAVDRCVGPALEGLGHKLGPLLLQFPPQGDEASRRPEAWVERLHSFLGGLPAGPRYVVELRDEALFCRSYVEALAATGAHHGYVSHPCMPTLRRQRELAPVRGPVTARWMLRRGLAYQQAKQRYEPFDALVDRDPEARAELTSMALEAAALNVEMVVVVNNKAEGSSPLSVLELARQIAQASLLPNARSTSGS